MVTTGILGGTFNPIHKGHVYLGQTLARKLALDKVLLIPTNSPPHKEASHLASAEHRLEMCRIAARGTGLFEVSDIEIKRKGKSFTFDTLGELKRANPDRKLVLLLGSDMFLSFEGWRQHELIFSLAAIAAIARLPGEYDKMLAHCERLKMLGAEVSVVLTEPLKVSSTEIREGILAGEDISAFLPDGVGEYIRKHRLYFSAN